MKKYTKILSVFLSAILLVALLAGCGSSIASDYKTSNGMAEGYNDEVGIVPEYNDAGEKTSNVTHTDGQNQNVSTNRKLIKTIRIDAETNDYTVAMSKLEDKVSVLGGYIESIDAYTDGDCPHASLTIRIPVNKLEELAWEIAEQTNVTFRSEEQEDVSLTYVDIESKRNALITEEERLLELLEQASSLTDILDIEDRLSTVRYQLESTESQLRVLDNLVDYATVYLTVEQVEVYTPVEEVGFLENICTGFKKSVHNVGEFFKHFAAFLLIYAPQIVVFVLLPALIVILIIRSKKRKRRRAKALKAGLQHKEEQLPISPAPSVDVPDEKQEC